MHDVDRSGGGALGLAVPKLKKQLPFQKQNPAPGTTCPYLTNLLQRSELSHNYEDLHCVWTFMLNMYWTAVVRMLYPVPLHGLYCAMVYVFSNAM